MTKSTAQSFVNAKEYYDLHKSVSSTFQILQVGLCTFKHISGEGKDKKYPFYSLHCSFPSILISLFPSLLFLLSFPSSSLFHSIIIDRIGYSCFPYNFFIFPEFHGKRGEDNIIRFSADATQFLRNYKFDFNRVFYKGVPYPQ